MKNLNLYPVNMTSNYNLSEILTASNEDQCGLSYYSKNKTLDNSHRIKIAHCVMEKELMRNADKSVASERLQFLAKQIVQAFPNEILQTWFDNSGSNNKGKLFVQYHSIRSLRKSEVLNKSKVDDYWEKTHPRRINTLFKSNIPIYQYYETYPALKGPSGYSMLETDYDLLHPDTALNLYNQWPNLCSFVIDMLKQANLSSLKKKKIDSFETLTEDEKAVFVFSYFHLLFPVITAVNKNKKSWRPSREEMRQTFLLHVKTYDDIKVQINQRKAKLLQWDLTLQPLAVVVGPSLDEISQAYVVMDEHFYAIESTIKAIDVTFKSFQALQASILQNLSKLGYFYNKQYTDIAWSFSRIRVSANYSYASLDVSVQY